MAVPLKMRGTVVGAIVVENKKGGLEFTLHELEILSTFANQAMVAIENAWLYEKVKSNYFATIQSLVNALEANDRYTKGHSERVRILATELGKYIGLDYKDLEILEHAAILHDIGKIGIDSMILSKKGKLTAPEYSVVKSHPLIGEEILSPIETLEDVRTTIIQHHERYDGLGYPYGLAGEETSLKARILAVVDTFDAMLTDRPYRKAFPYSKVIDELRAGAGTQFDPFVVESFIEMLQMKGQNYLMEIGYALTLSSSN
jgi:putative nucleotidyltransferase with HDIG domain